MDTEKGAYLFYDREEKRIILYIYFKLKFKELKKVLPISFTGPNKTYTNNYLIAFFLDGDYIGNSTFNQIKKLIKNKKMINLLNNNYENIKEKLDISFSEYINYLNFVKLQYKDFLQLRKK